MLKGFDQFQGERGPDHPYPAVGSDSDNSAFSTHPPWSAAIHPHLFGQRRLFSALQHGPAPPCRATLAVMSSACGWRFAVVALRCVTYVSRCGKRRGLGFDKTQRSAEVDRDCTPGNASVCSLPHIQHCGAREGEALGRRSTERLIEQRIAANGTRSVKRTLPADAIG